MTEVRIFTPENRLKKVLNDTSGETAATLSAASQNLVAGMAGGLRKKVQEEIARLAALRAGGDAAMLARPAALSGVVMSIVEIAGAAGRPQLGEAARGVLAMLDGLDGAGAAHKEALIVHVGAVMLLGAEPPPTRQDADGVLRQLAQMRRFLGVTD